MYKHLISSHYENKLNSKLNSWEDRYTNFHRSALLQNCKWSQIFQLTHWVRVTHICVGNLTSIVSGNGLSLYRRQAIVWTNAGILLVGPLGTNFSEILIEILTFSFKKMRLKVSSAKRRPFRIGLNVLSISPSIPVHGFTRCRTIWYVELANAGRPNAILVASSPQTTRVRPTTKNIACSCILGNGWEY